MKTGLDRLPELHSLKRELSNSRVGLVAHGASVDRRLVHTLDVLSTLGIAPKVLFGPEHGWQGAAQDMIGVRDSTGNGELRIVSLYGERFEDLSPKPVDLEGLDIVIIDMQDVGSRYYTFVWTAVLVLRACRAAGVRVVVLDRPNPLGTVTLEGRLQQPGFLSFVGLEALPIRHGLTLGEIVLWRAVVENCAELVTVVGVEDVAADAHASEWDRPFVMPSPNMPAYETALVYPGGCLLEGTNLSDGRGTTRPFELTGAPWISGKSLATALMSTGLPGFIARPVFFEPTFHKHAKCSCGGVQIHVTHPAAFRPVATYATLITLAHHQSPKDFRFRTERYEFIDTIPAFDLLTGSSEAREAILAFAPAVEVAKLVAHIGEEERDVVQAARRTARLK